MPLAAKKGRTQTLNMKIAFRADASTMIGSGHVMRCLTLADMLRTQGDETLFLCREYPGNLNAEIENRGHALYRLPAHETTPLSESSDPTHASWLGDDPQTDASECAIALAAWGRPDWLVVDHYAIDQRWQSLMRQHCNKIMIIDDLADRLHDCDILLDQNLYTGMRERYIGKVPAQCQLYLGPFYALLRNEFRTARLKASPRSGPVHRIFIFFGGVDAANCTGTTINALTYLNTHLIAVDVVIGAQHPARQEVEDTCTKYGFSCHIQTAHIAELMVKADLAIGAGGSASWERCSVGLPALIVSVAANQTQIAQELHDAGACCYLGEIANIDCEFMRAAVTELLADQQRLRNYSQTALQLVDGLGCERMCKIMRGQP